ncbi:helix-turn-helix domain-containing protein [Streptomyces avicenniae]|uniref:helix-turn-helix domain-containing protein n=1 Tax=Streptomyces avicenniae TaxID=500153 RepID=UPI001CBA6951|nr:helix-turn-helix transcriptional regulator [Streptomyces avicenniae]
MDARAAERPGYPLTIPDALLNSEAMRKACAVRDFAEVFRLVNRRTGTSQADMAAAIGKMTNSRISDVMRGVRSIRGTDVIERIADAFGIPGHMLDLPPRPWERSPEGADGTSIDNKRVPGALVNEQGGADGSGSGTSQESEVAPVGRSALDSAGAAALAAGHMPTVQMARGRCVVQALEVMGSDSPGVMVDALGELIDHYASTISGAVPVEVYDELVVVRSHVNEYLKDSRAMRLCKDMGLAAGWLSCLLAIAACDMGAHAASNLWCADAERRSRETGHPELAGWAMLTRSMIAYYQGRSGRSAALASQGQRSTSLGTIVHAKLAAQEMRSAAMAGDAAGMDDSLRYAATAMRRIPSSSLGLTGAFSIASAEDPPYTATSLMLLGRFSEAVSATDRVIQAHHRPEAHRQGENPSGHARALLVMGLAQAGRGDLEEAAAAGHAALTRSRPAWPTVVLAGKLDRVLERDFSTARQTAEYRARYLETASRLRSPNPSPMPEGRE